jgi:hypothetical protein
MLHVLTKYQRTIIVAALGIVIVPTIRLALAVPLVVGVRAVAHLLVAAVSVL